MLFVSFEPMTRAYKISSQSKVFSLSGRRCHYRLNQYRQRIPEVQQAEIL